MDGPFDATNAIPNEMTDKMKNVRLTHIYRDEATSHR